jgi:hypothetical protein
VRAFFAYGFKRATGHGRKRSEVIGLGLRLVTVVETKQLTFGHDVS